MTFLHLLSWALFAAALGFALWQRGRFHELRLARARAEDALREVEKKLLRISQAVESASDAIGIGDFEGNSLYHNRAHVALFGYTVPELNALPRSGALFADPKVAAEILRTVHAGRSWMGETEVQTRDGRRIPAFVRADVILDEHKNPVGVFAVFTDITERRQAARQLEGERQRLGITLQSIAEGVIATDPLGRVELMNRMAEQLTGWKQAEAARLPLGTVLNLLEEATRKPRLLAGSAPAADRNTLRAEISAVLVARDGGERVIAGKCTPLPAAEGGGSGVVVVFRDTTAERRQADDRERAGKLESLGLLAGGVAHDFANLLTAIMAHLSLAQTAAAAGGTVAKHLAEIERASWRARDLTQHLLTFAKGGAPVKKIVAIDTIIRDSVGFALHQAPHVTARFVLPQSLWCVEADPAQLGQVINNLALNAAQAMGNRGTLLIMAENVEPGGEQGPGRAVHISLTDTGAGIAPENIPKLFDPFFTTKTTGAGLGLAMVYSIVKKHGGRVHVDSTVGYGTTFHVYLPAAAAEAVVERISSASPFPVAAGAAAKPAPLRVLLMDDESEVRETVGIMLVLLGCQVETAKEGQEALDLFEKARGSSRPFNAVILDLRVPEGMGGAETIKRLRAIDPKLKALVASGYSEDPTMADHRAAGFDAAIAKPFNLDELRAVIEKLTDPLA